MLVAKFNPEISTLLWSVVTGGPEARFGQIQNDFQFRKLPFGNMSSEHNRLVFDAELNTREGLKMPFYFKACITKVLLVQYIYFIESGWSGILMDAPERLCPPLPSPNQIRFNQIELVRWKMKMHLVIDRVKFPNQPVKMQQHEWLSRSEKLFII